MFRAIISHILWSIIPSLDVRAVSWPWEERYVHSMASARHGKCESDTASLYKSDGKDTF